MKLLTIFLAAYALLSPNGKLEVKIETGNALKYSVYSEKTEMISPSEISMTLSDGTVYGGKATVSKVERKKISATIDTPIYKKAQVDDNCNEMTLYFKNFSLVVRAYDDGAAYRFVSRSKKDFTVVSEEATFKLPENWNAWIPYVRKAKGPQSLEDQLMSSFENVCTHQAIADWDNKRLAFLPLTIDAAGGKKICITESDLRHYPGLFLHNAGGATTLEGVFAKYPTEYKKGGHWDLYNFVTKRDSYIAKANAGQEFPWRVIIVADNAPQLVENDLSYILSKAPENVDWSWVKPGKVCWDWWCDWNIYGVDFKAGINNKTYEYLIDFAAVSGLEYVIFDAGWSVLNEKMDLTEVVPELDLPYLVKYGKERNVGLILWCGYNALNQDIEGAIKHYSEMGIVGFKVDYMNRDDQEMVDFVEKVAETAAKYHLTIDFHGVYKPAGFTRTYPNVLNFEGIFGLEQMKFKKDVSCDMVIYDVTLPYTRFVAGPADYTQGAMLNGTKQSFHNCNQQPMSLGTRCRQIAQYVIFDSPLVMLCDSPSNYYREPECTSFISDIPVVWDETIGLAGEIGQYVSVARRSGNDWWIGAMTDWNARDLEVDFSFLPEGEYQATIFKDGINAEKAAQDFAFETIDVNKTTKLKVHLATAGGVAIKISK